MSKRKIITINEDDCNGCGICIDACHESAIEIVDGKAKLVSDMYCDGLGDCLPNCPMDAIKMIEREADEYSQEAVDKRIENLKSNDSKCDSHTDAGCGCSGTTPMTINPVSENKPSDLFKMSDLKGEIKTTPHEHKHSHAHGEGGCNCNSKKKAFVFNERPNDSNEKIHSELRQWPVQIKLINTSAEYLKDADILVAADCTAYAYGDFHRDFVKNRVVMIGCPKLDDNQFYIEKLTEIFTKNNINSLTVVRMEVPCCSGITMATRKALELCGKNISYKEINVGVNGVLV